MAVWDGWQIQLLDAANISGNEATASFLTDWNAHANSDCANNPVDISRAATGAANCRRLTRSRTAKKYTSHAQAATAFARELESGNFPHLLGAIRNADPYQNPNPSQVAADFRTWGSSKMASYYLDHASSGSGSGTGGGGGGGTPHTHKGWEDLRHSFNHNMPRSLNQSERNIAAALRSLSRSRKVRI